jgi:hypothetical protein
LVYAAARGTAGERVVCREEYVWVVLRQLPTSKGQLPRHFQLTTPKTTSNPRCRRELGVLLGSWALEVPWKLVPWTLVLDLALLRK